jgi:hypothetical protein
MTRVELHYSSVPTSYAHSTPSAQIVDATEQSVSRGQVGVGQRREWDSKREWDSSASGAATRVGQQHEWDSKREWDITECTTTESRSQA